MSDLDLRHRAGFAAPSTTVILLGPQDRGVSRLAAALAAHGFDGPLCAVSAGWQEDEGTIDELAGLARCVDLRLYHRAETLFAALPALFQLHRERQTRLQTLQRLYRLRLAHALAAWRELRQAVGDDPRWAEQRRAALTAVRLLDRQHGRHIRTIHREFAQRVTPQAWPALAAQRAELAERIAASQAVLLAGGHVAVLTARLRLFDLGPLLAGKPLLAWSAGAMALTERVVAFHDHPPQGGNDPELLDAGLGLVTGLVALPHAARRLELHNRERLATLAGRFAPAQCVTLDRGAALCWRGGRPRSAESVWRLRRDGRLRPLCARAGRKGAG